MEGLSSFAEETFGLRNVFAFYSEFPWFRLRDLSGNPDWDNIKEWRFGEVIEGEIRDSARWEFFSVMDVGLGDLSIHQYKFDPEKMPYDYRNYQFSRSQKIGSLYQIQPADVEMRIEVFLINPDGVVNLLLRLMKADIPEGLIEAMVNEYNKTQVDV